MRDNARYCRKSGMPLLAARALFSAGLGTLGLPTTNGQTSRFSRRGSVRISLNQAVVSPHTRVRGNGDPKRSLRIEELRNRRRSAMKTVAILTAIVTVMVAATANAGQPTSHQPGSPLQQGKYCWVYTGGNG